MYTCTAYNVDADFEAKATARGYLFDAGGCLVQSDRTNSDSVTVDVGTRGSRSTSTPPTVAISRRC